MRTHTALLIAAAIFFVVASPARAAVVVGIGEQSTEMFSDPRYEALDVHHARFVTPWDALHDNWETSQLDSYMLQAKAMGTNVLLTFGRSNQHTRELPSPARLAREFLRFRARYPWVTDYVTWNEANHCSQPTCRRPDRVAEYYVALKNACRRCGIVAADLLDDSKIGQWASDFLDVAGRDRSLIWGLHNYIDANRFRTRGTRALLKATRGDVWFTETGGLVMRRNGSTVAFPGSTRHAAEATTWVFRLAALSPRVKRVYFYHWSPARVPHPTWDSALVDGRDRPRPAYEVLQRWLQEHPR
jgi:polysaccharide biosynthesis protein PslG